MGAGSGDVMLCGVVGVDRMEGSIKVDRDEHGRDKGRGSYRCGKCGVPKKGHICPYQPKFKRRPDEPPPETRNASTQVEMDEFLVLRRLNLEIQGFPESYTSDPTNNVGAEPHGQQQQRTHAVPSPNGPPSMQSPPMNVGGRVLPGMTPSHGMIPPVRSQMGHGRSPGGIQGMSPHSAVVMGRGGMVGRPSPPSTDGRGGEMNGIGMMGGGVVPPPDVGSSSNSVRNGMERDGSRGK